MNTNLIQLKNIFSKSSLVKEEQENLLKFFSKAQDQELIDLIILFETDPNNIEIINNIYKAKLQAFKDKDIDKLEEIINQEYKSLKFLATN